VTPVTTIVSFGRLERGKGLERTLSCLPDLGSGYRLVIVGEGPHRGALEAHAADLRVRGRVDFRGAASDEELYRWLHDADVVVRVPDTGTSGIALLEAAAAGTPVIATDLPAHRESAQLIAHAGITLIDAEPSPLLIADAIRAAVAAPAAPPPRDQLPSWSDVRQRMEAFYRSVIAGAAADADHAVPETPAELPFAQAEPTREF
jgi:glycosyltransferase involved in cell wall biosynthesis